jgi:hypothetical protein
MLNLAPHPILVHKNQGITLRVYGKSRINQTKDAPLFAISSGIFSDLQKSRIAPLRA